MGVLSDPSSGTVRTPLRCFHSLFSLRIRLSSWLFEEFRIWSVIRTIAWFNCFRSEYCFIVGIVLFLRYVCSPRSLVASFRHGPLAPLNRKRSEAVHTIQNISLHAIAFVPDCPSPRVNPQVKAKLSITTSELAAEGNVEIKEPHLAHPSPPKSFPNHSW